MLPLNMCLQAFLCKFVVHAYYDVRVKRANVALNSKMQLKMCFKTLL
jgi:hypothetical protein